MKRAGDSRAPMIFTSTPHGPDPNPFFKAMQEAKKEPQWQWKSGPTATVGAEVEKIRADIVALRDKAVVDALKLAWGGTRKTAAEIAQTRPDEITAMLDAEPAYPAFLGGPLGSKRHGEAVAPGDIVKAPYPGAPAGQFALYKASADGMVLIFKGFGREEAIAG